MQRAAAGLATVCLRLLGGVYGRRVVLLVGTGNNGGDALFAGARAGPPRRPGHRRPARPDRAHPPGWPRCAGPAAGPGRRTDRRRPGVGRADLVLDGMLGIGGRGRPARRAPPARPTPRRTRRGLTVAVDVPSGVDADTGAVDGRRRSPAMHTVTFGAVKPGLVVGDGRAHAGRGAPGRHRAGPHLPPPTAFRLTDADVAARLAPPVGGRRQVLAGRGRRRRRLGDLPGCRRCSAPAPRCAPGPGLVRYAGTRGRRRPRRLAGGDRHRRPARRRRPGAGLGGRARAWAPTTTPRSVLAEVLATDLPVLVDADALTLLAARARPRPAAAPRPTLLTPHDREFARFGAERRAPTGSARPAGWPPTSAAPCCSRASATVVADADGTAFVNATGTPWLATAGTGDVLVGHRGAAARRRPAAGRGGAVAAHLHGRAGAAGGRARAAARRRPGPAAARGRSAGCAGSRPSAWETRTA